jgi:hypothetical protein
MEDLVSDGYSKKEIVEPEKSNEVAVSQDL